MLDDDIVENLKELSNLVQALGRQISSKKANLEGLKLISDSLPDVKKTLDAYIRLQKKRNKENELLTRRH